MTKISVLSLFNSLSKSCLGYLLWKAQNNSVIPTKISAFERLSSLTSLCRAKSSRRSFSCRNEQEMSQVKRKTCKTQELRNHLVAVLIIFYACRQLTKVYTFLFSLMLESAS